MCAKQGGKDGYILTKPWHLPSKMAVVPTTAPWSTAGGPNPRQDQRNKGGLPPRGFSLCVPFLQVSEVRGAPAHPRAPQDSLQSEPMGQRL